VANDDTANAAEATSNIGRRRASAKKESGPAYEARRAEIMTAAGPVFMAKGYSATSFKDIAEGLGLDRATLYYYFASKQELVQTATEAAFARYADAAEELAASDANAADKLERLFTQNMVWNNDPDLLYVNFFIQEDVVKQMTDENADWTLRITAQRRKYEAALTRIFEDAMASGEFRSDLPPMIFTKAVIGMANWTQRWFDPRGALTAEEVAAMFTRIILRGATG
jgi:AcrR family transcriptional regulator